MRQLKLTTLLIAASTGARIRETDDQEQAVVPRAPHLMPVVPEMEKTDIIPQGLFMDPKVAIYVRCENLNAREIISETDSRARVEYLYKGQSGQELLQISKTDIVDNVKSPNYAKPLRIFLPNPMPKTFLNFSIYDIYNEMDYMRIGSFTVDLPSLLARAKKDKLKPIKFVLCRKGVSAKLGDGEVGCALGDKDVWKRNFKPSVCSLTGWDTWTSRSRMKMQMFAMDLANRDKMKIISPKEKRQVWIKGLPLPVGTDPYLQLYASRSVNQPCRIKSRDQIMWKGSKTLQRPGGTLDPNCVGPLALKTKWTKKKAVVRGYTKYEDDRSTESYDNKGYLSWSPFSVDVDELCGGEMEREVSIIVWDDDGDKKQKRDDMVGATSVPCSAFKTKDSLQGFGNLTQDGYKGSQGFLFLNSTEWVQEIVASEYTASGVEIKVNFAVDFSKSNVLQPVDDQETLMQGGLHALKDGKLNDYELVLSNVAKMLGKYDSDNKMPLWTFGGLHNTGNGQKDSLFVTSKEGWEGSKGVVEAYRKEVKACLDGSWPKYKVPPGWGEGTPKGWCFGGSPESRSYEELINKAAEDARADTSTSYHVLVVLTDGDETLFSKFGHRGSAEVERALKWASHETPLTVIFVGIGSERSNGLKKLRNLEKNTCKGKNYRRDNLDVLILNELVEANRIEQREADIKNRTNQFNAKGWRAAWGQSHIKQILTKDELLSRSVLEELPEHVLTYFSDYQQTVPKHTLQSFMQKSDLKVAGQLQSSKQKSKPLYLEKLAPVAGGGDLCLPDPKIPPERLRVADLTPQPAPFSQVATTTIYSPMASASISGFYYISNKIVNGCHVWKQNGGTNFIFCDRLGYYIFGRKPESNTGEVSSKDPVGGRWPHEVSKWSFQHIVVEDTTVINHIEFSSTGRCISKLLLTVRDAKKMCTTLPLCTGITFQGSPNFKKVYQNNFGKKMIHFKNHTKMGSGDWTSYIVLRPDKTDDHTMSLFALQYAVSEELYGEATARILGPKKPSACGYNPRRAQRRWGSKKKVAVTADKSTFRAISVCTVPNIWGTCPRPKPVKREKRDIP